MTKKRRLTDLYIVGKELSIDDGSDDPIVVWIQKLNPIENEYALREANKSRAALLALKKADDDDPELDVYWSQLEADLASDVNPVDVFVAREEVKIRAAKEDQVAYEDEWSEDNYLQGLKDAWEGGLKETYALDNSDPEALRVWNELKRFDALVEEKVQGELRHVRRDYEQADPDWVRREYVNKIIERDADVNWVTTYRRNEIRYAVREPDNHKEYYFADADEVAQLAVEIFKQLVQEYQELIVDPLEGKG